MKVHDKYNQEFYTMRLFFNKALTYKAAGLIIDYYEKAINFHIVSGHV
jgi:hypothetical protein